MSPLRRRRPLEGVGCPSARLLEEDIRHVGLNIVCVGGDGRCADFRRHVQ